jgi:integration host factor subunit beta
MNKADLIEAFKMETDLTKKEAAAIVILFFGEISNTLANDNRFEIRGLCSFYVEKYSWTSLTLTP